MRKQILIIRKRKESPKALSDRLFSYMIIVVSLLLILAMFFFFRLDSFLKEEQGQVLIGASFPSLNNSFYKELVKELDANVQIRGKRLLVRDCGMDEDLQKEQIRFLEKQNIQVLIVCPVNESTLSEVLEECLSAHIRVILIGDGEPQGKISTVTSDFESAGEQLAHYLAGQTASAKILVITRENSVAADNLVTGFAKALEEQPEYVYFTEICLENSVQSAREAVEKAIKADLDFDTILTINEGFGIGAFAAVRDAGLQDEVCILSMDGGPDGKHMIRNGCFLATAQQFPSLIAERALAVADQPEEEILCEKVPVKLITRNTIASYDMDKWE